MFAIVSASICASEVNPRNSSRVADSLLVVSTKTNTKRKLLFPRYISCLICQNGEPHRSIGGRNSVFTYDILTDVLTYDILTDVLTYDILTDADQLIRCPDRCVFCIVFCISLLHSPCGHLVFRRRLLCRTETGLECSCVRLFST